MKFMQNQLKFQGVFRKIKKAFVINALFYTLCLFFAEYSQQTDKDINEIKVKS